MSNEKLAEWIREFRLDTLEEAARLVCYECRCAENKVKIDGGNVFRAIKNKDGKYRHQIGPTDIVLCVAYAIREEIEK